MRRVGDGLVAGEEDGEDFVADLLVGHAGLLGGVVGFVFAGEEHGEQVAACLLFFAGLAAGGCFAMLANEAVDDCVEAGFGAAELHDAGDRQVEDGFNLGKATMKL